MAAPAAKKHFFVINQLGQSAHRRGPFESAEAAREWADKHYRDYPAWIVPAEPVSPLCRPLAASGEPAKKG